MSTPRLFILLPVYNRKHITEKFIQCLLRQTYTNYELILIDDGSGDGTAEMVGCRVPGATIITGDGNLWWAGALQKGFEYLRKLPSTRHDDVVMIANDDIVFKKEFLEIGVRKILNHEHSFISASLYSFDDNRRIGAGVAADLKVLSFSPTNDPKEINCLPTRALFTRRRYLPIVGSFHPRVLPHFLSDYEYTIRAHKKGFHLSVSDELNVWVDEKTTHNKPRKLNTLAQFLKHKFSNRCPSNPIHWSIFCFLACESPWNGINALNVWGRFGLETYSLLKKRFL